MPQKIFGLSTIFDEWPLLAVTLNFNNTVTSKGERFHGRKWYSAVYLPCPRQWTCSVWGEPLYDCCHYDAASARNSGNYWKCRELPANEGAVAGITTRLATDGDTMIIDLAFDASCILICVLNIVLIMY